MQQKGIGSQNFLKTFDGEIYAVVQTADGEGKALFRWDGSWVRADYIEASWVSNFLTRDEAISLIGLKAVKALPKER